MDGFDKFYVIIGSSGFIGMNLVEQMIMRGYYVLGIDINKIENDKCHDFIQGDWTKIDFENLIDGIPHGVVNLAAITDLSGQNLSYYSLNFSVNTSFVDWVNGAGIHYIFFSTQLVHAYGDEGNMLYSSDTFYGASKALGEKVTQEKFDKYSIVRPTSVWGPHMKYPYKGFFEMMRKFNLSFTSSSFQVKKSFYYVGYVLRDLEELRLGEITYFTNEAIYLSDWIKLAAISTDTRLIVVPPFALKLLAKLGDFFKFLPYSTPRHRNMTTSSQIPGGSVISQMKLSEYFKTTINSL